MKQFRDIINGTKPVFFNGVKHTGSGTSYEVFDEKMQEIATKLGWQKEWLYAVMHVESAGTFSPKVKNPKSSATGLIQFMEATAKGLGTSTKSLANMSGVQQLDYVYKYFLPYKSKVKSGYDVYVAVFRPSWLNNKQTVIKITSADYAPNKALDVTNNGDITYQDFILWVQKRNPTIVSLFEAGITKKAGVLFAGLLVVALALTI